MTSKPDSEIYYEIVEIMHRYILELKLRRYQGEISHRDLEGVKRRCKHELKPYKAHVIKMLVSQGQNELLKDLDLK